MELHELQILEGQTCTGDHCVAVTRAGVRTRAAEVRTPVTTSCQHSLVCPEAVKRAVLHVQRNDADTLAILHDQVEREVFNEEVRVVAEGLAVEGVEEGVSSSVGGGGAAVCLATLSKLQGLTTECALVDFALLRPREGHAEVLELDNGLAETQCVGNACTTPR